MIQYCVAVLEKATIPCRLRLVLDNLGSSEPINSALLDHLLPGSQPGHLADIVRTLACRKLT